MRLGLVGVAAALLLSGSLAGCLERRGTLAVELAVSDGGAIGEFRSASIQLYRVTIDARTLNPQPVPSRVDRVELVSAARGGETFELFREEVRADRYDRVTVTTPPGATFQGTLQDGTTVAVVVPNEKFSLTTGFEVPRGGSTSYLLTIRLEKVDTGTGSPSYTVVPEAETSGPRAG